MLISGCQQLCSDSSIIGTFANCESESEKSIAFSPLNFLVCGLPQEDDSPGERLPPQLSLHGYTLVDLLEVCFLIDYKLHQDDNQDQPSYGHFRKLSPLRESWQEPPSSLSTRFSNILSDYLRLNGDIRMFFSFLLKKYGFCQTQNSFSIKVEATGKLSVCESTVTRIFILITSS